MSAHAGRTHGTVATNGLDLYFEISGQGEPLIILPGGFMTVEAMGEIIPLLAERRQVIGVELQGHGHTADVDRPLRFETMADDIAALLAHLGLKQADLFGYSLGGGVALQTAIRHPALVRKLVLVSTPCKRDGWYPEVLRGMASITPEGFAGTPIYEEYLRTSPKPEAWPTVVGKMVQLLGEDYDWTDDVRSLTCPTMLIVGDADSVRLDHAVEFFKLLGGGQGDGDAGVLSPSRLAILPATTHVGWMPPKRGMMNRTNLLVPMTTEFLDAPMPAPEA